MKNYRDLLKEELKNPEFKKEYDALEPEFRKIRQQLDSTPLAPIKYDVRHGQITPQIAMFF